MIGPLSAEVTIEDLVVATVPRRWCTDSSIRLAWIGRGVAVKSFETVLKTAEKAGFVEIRSASLSRPGDPGDDDLPVMTADRAKVRQIKRLFESRAEKAAHFKAPAPISLEKALKRHAEHFPPTYSRSAPPFVDPVRAEFIRLREQADAQAKEIEDLRTRLDAALATDDEPTTGGLLRRRKH